MRERDDESVERAASELRQPVHFGEAFDARVMAAVRAQPRHRFGPWRRMLRPRTITVSPALWSLAAAVLVAAAISAGHAIGSSETMSLRGDSAPRGERPPAARAGHRDVQFVLVAPTARKVSVVGDFNDWDSAHAAFQAEHRGGGVWSVTAPVPVGHHRYSFVVDDSVWVTDPAAPRAVDNDFGTPSSALVVGGDAR